MAKRSCSEECMATTPSSPLSTRRSSSAPSLIDHESEMALVIHRHTNATRIPSFNYHDGINQPAPSTTPQAVSRAVSPSGPVEYGELQHQVTPPCKTPFRTVPMGFLDDLVPQKGRRLRKHCHEFEPYEGHCRADSPLERIHPEQGCMPILRAVYFSRNNNDLDKENAHFKLAEALISTFELLKWKSYLSRSSSEVSHLDWEVGTAAVEQQLPGSDEGRVDEQDRSDESSEAIEAKENTCDLRTYSAEEIAIGLLNKFQDRQLPSAGDFLWLVSEQDAPQKLLPVPSGGVVDPDDTQSPDAGTLIRGTQEWAPPRPQAIFTYKPPPLERRVQIARQGNRCEGCGTKVNLAYLSRYRYCHYTGKYNCSGCHKNQMAIVPARVIQRWDFTVLPVSVFAYRVLGDIWSTPLYLVNHLYPELYGLVKSLRLVRQARVNLKFAKDFILNCRYSESTRHVFQEVPEYFTSDFDKWSMADFLAVKSGALQRLLASIESRCEAHILSCELCLGRGFVCEKCIGGRAGRNVLFPWQPKVVRCEECGNCYHGACWRKDKSCDRCDRIRRRQTTAAEGPPP
ncbi:run domain Beclin-1-interacting and cysteine-rich domain-containing protein-like [Anopheles nili]|uniref:run domain Beclin-1-interacting and cysteine-rich domain-containing protein-like n=1 Tax=Anopheles nili TaxID=185578 RepID=UPI00237A4C8A|nr:run domain Beclin-1-interacting and cysteine-rich domain-containing protein-like [Anopheles nili]